MDELKSVRAKLLLVHHPDKNHLDDKEIAEANSCIIIHAFMALEKTVQLLLLPSLSLTTSDVHKGYKQKRKTKKAKVKQSETITKKVKKV